MKDPMIQLSSLGVSKFRLGFLLAACLWSAHVVAQANYFMTPIPSPDQSNAIELGTGPLPDAKAQESGHSQYGSRFARNVTVATLTPFLPEANKASGAAVIVAPGGGFRTLSMDNEGWDVAKALASQGIAAFVLKYRLNQTPADMAAFEQLSDHDPCDATHTGMHTHTQDPLCLKHTA